jgi:hypothetical protein
MRIKKENLKTIIHETPIKSDLEQHHFINQELKKSIEKKAYELYQGRGCVAGHEIEDWVEAERIVKECTRDKAIA